MKNTKSKKITKLFIVTSILSIGSSFSNAFAIEREIAELTDSYIKIAEKSARVYVQGKHCEVGTSLSHILNALETAQNFDSQRVVAETKKSKNIKKAIGETLSYRLLVEKADYLLFRNIKNALPGTAFHGKPIGLHGDSEIIIFKENGKILLRKGKFIKDRAGSTKMAWQENSGVWSLKNVSTKFIAKAEITITVDNETKKYILKSNPEYRESLYEFILEPANRDPRGGDVLSEYPNECGE